MADEYGIRERVPTAAEHSRLRRIAGLSPMGEAATARGLPNSCFAVVIEHHGQAIGMGRIIGDGGLFFQIVDIAVDPAHQGKGLGKAIMARLVAWLREHASGGYVSLIADGEAKRLYAQYGFAPTAPASIGMAMRVDQAVDS